MSDQPSLTDWWFCYDRWPGPDYEVQIKPVQPTKLQVGQIVAEKSDPTRPIGIITRCHNDPWLVDVKYHDAAGARFPGHMLVPYVSSSDADN